MNRQITTLLILSLVLIGTFTATAAHAQEPPPLPHSFYGTVEVNGQPAPVGAQIEARGAGVKVAVNNPLAVTVAGSYGGPTINEPKLAVQGSVQNETPIEFYVDGVRAQCSVPDGAWEDTYAFNPGVVTRLNLRVGQAAEPTATPTATATISPPTLTPTETTTPVPPTVTPIATSSPGSQAPQATATATIQGVPATATRTLSQIATGTPAAVVATSVVRPGSPTPIPGAVVATPTLQPGQSVAVTLSATPAQQPGQHTATPALVQEVVASAEQPAATLTPAVVAQKPVATSKPILQQETTFAAQASGDQASSTSVSSQTNSGRMLAVWGGLGALLIAGALAIFLKTRGLHR